MKLLAKTVFLLLFSLPMTAAAALDVEFEATPLFSDANVLPGDSVTRTVTVTNTGEESEEVLVGTTNVFGGDLADLITLAIFTDDSTYFDDTFTNFFAAGEVTLGPLAPAETVTYNFTADFANTTENDLMGSSFGFDLVVGFSGGAQIVNQRSGSGGTAAVAIFNESAEESETTGGEAVVRWNTNRAASSFVVCGNADEGPFVLNPDHPLFGYQFSVPEQPSDTEAHLVTLSGLAPGEYECRPASRSSERSDFTVGSPTLFTVAGRNVVTPTELLPETVTIPIPEPAVARASEGTTTPTGVVAGTSTATTTEVERSSDAPAAAAAENETAPEERDLFWLAVFLVLIAVLSLVYWLRLHRKI